MTGLDPRFVESLRWSMLSSADGNGTIDPSALLGVDGGYGGVGLPASQVGLGFGDGPSQASTLAATMDDVEDSEEEAQSAAEALIPVPVASTSRLAAPPRPLPEVLVGSVFDSLDDARGAVHAVARKLGLDDARVLRPKHAKRATRFVCTRDKCLGTVNLHPVSGSQAVCVFVSASSALIRSARSPSCARTRASRATLPVLSTSSAYDRRRRL